MANIYWYQSGSDSLWTNEDNWFTDAAHTTPAEAIPVTNDYVYMFGTNSPSAEPDAITLSGLDTTGFTGSLSIGFANVTIAEGGAINIGILGSFITHAWNGVGTAAASCSIVGSLPTLCLGSCPDGSVFNGAVIIAGNVNGGATFNGSTTYASPDSSTYLGASSGANKIVNWNSSGYLGLWDGGESTHYPAYIRRVDIRVSKNLTIVSCNTAYGLNVDGLSTITMLNRYGTLTMTNGEASKSIAFSMPKNATPSVPMGCI